MVEKTTEEQTPEEYFHVYTPYLECTDGHNSVLHSGGEPPMELAVCDMEYSQLNQWTMNSRFIMEVIRAIKLGIKKNPYKNKRVNNVTLSMSQFKMFQQVVFPKDKEHFRIAIRNNETSIRLFTFDMKRAKHYLHIFEDAMKINKTKVTTYIDHFENIYFFTSDPVWVSQPFLLDLYFHIIFSGDTVLMGQSIYSLLTEISYGASVTQPYLKTLHDYRHFISELAYGHIKYFEGKDFWSAPQTAYQFTDTYNLITMLSGGLMHCNRDKGLYRPLKAAAEAALGVDDVPF